jgi:diaminopimelate decarboxylase
MDISWELLYSLEKQYGDSFYLLDLDRFHENYHEFLEAFRTIYPNTNIAYSYKTNYTLKLCQMVNSWGGYAEVVSKMEYDLALKIGVSPKHIIFNGPYKCEPELEKALLAGATVNLDSFYEVSLVEKFAKNYPSKKISIGVRCNFDVGSEEISRFGFDVERDEFGAVFDILKQINNCNIAGLHCHFLPPERSVDAYSKIAKKMIDLSGKFFLDGPPQFIDLGGGFFSKMSPHLREQFPFHVPSFKEYAKAIASQIADKFSNTPGPELILEPGIAITADVMQFVTKVIDIKQVRDRKHALVSGSIYNVKPTKSRRNLPIQIFTNRTIGNNQKKSGSILDIVGYTCMEDDCLYESYRGLLDAGDYVVFNNVGSYTLVLKPPFILPCPVVLAYDSNTNEFNVIKRQEELHDIFSTYLL